MKKLTVLLAILLPLVMLAQDLEGEWKLHPAYLLTQANDMIDVEQHVYALTNGVIVRLDKASGQIQALSTATGLSEVKVKNIYYNYDRHYLLIVYNNSNIDFLFDDGRIVNVNDLASVVMTTSRAVNDVSFANGKVFLATDFGMMIIDDAMFKVTEFRQYGKALTSVTMVGDRTVISLGGKLYASNGSRELISDYEPIGITLAEALLRPIDDNNFFVMGTGALQRCQFANDGQCTATTIVSAKPNNLQRMPGGWLANFRSNSYYYTIQNDEAFTATKVTATNTSLFSCNPDSDGSIVWQIDGNGIHQKGSTNYFNPDGIHFRTGDSYLLYYAYYHDAENKFYVTTVPQRRPVGNGNDAPLCYALTYDGQQWLDETPTALRNVTKMSTICFIPWLDNAYFLSVRNSGNNTAVYRVVNGQVDLQIKPVTNFPINNCCQPRLTFDYEGNLWLCSTRKVTTSPLNLALMLPHEKVMAASIAPSDWIVVNIPNLSDGSFQNQQFVVGKGNVKVANGGDQENYSTLWRGTPDADGNGVESIKMERMINQYGQAIDNHLNYVYTMSVDTSGYVWVGNYFSPLYYFDPSEAFNADFRVTQPKVTNSDLDPYSVTNHIAVDYQNRKWICSAQNGLFVVSPDGSQLLKHFNVDNSNIPSSKVYYCAVSPERAVVTTDLGVAEFDMTEIPSVIDYTAVKAAPTLVEPTYTGFVTIGQVDVGACVRITDRDGNLVRELIATGNQVMWDTCDDTGERVPTGVYNIYAGLSSEQLPGTPQVRVKIIK